MHEEFLLVNRKETTCKARRRWQKNIKMHPQETGRKMVTAGIKECRTLESTMLNIRMP